MEPFTIAGGVISGLIVAAVTGGLSYFVGRKKGHKQGKKDGEEETKKRFSQKYDASIKEFSNEIYKIIVEANRTKIDEELIARAIAIVTTRDSMKENLTELNKLLNSNIDSLKNVLKSRKTAKTKDGKYHDSWIEEVRLYVGAIHESWPAKKPQIDSACRKLVTDLGLAEIFE